MMAGNRVIFSAEVVRYHVRFLWAQTEELKKRGYKLLQLLVLLACVWLNSSMAVIE